jgi:hypothetical protein
MNPRLVSLLLVALPGCALFHRYPRPPHAPPEESAQFQFPFELPTDGRQVLSGTTATAIQLAADDFRPPGTKPHDKATALEQCLYRRESFDVYAAPGPEGVTLVRFVFNPDACPSGGPVMDAGATYAIDVKRWRILAVE